MILAQFFKVREHADNRGVPETVNCQLAIFYKCFVITPV